MVTKNQGYLRRSNKNSIIKALLTGKHSYSELARRLKLSNAAISKIVDELLEKQIVERGDTTKGRGGIEIGISGSIGYILAIDFSGEHIKIVAVNLNGTVISEKTGTRIVTINSQVVGNIMQDIDGVCKIADATKLKLKTICIATPGKVDQSGNILQNPRIRNFPKSSLKQIFKEKFDCPIIVKNDLKLALEGEYFCGDTLKDTLNAIMLHSDVGMGAALLFGGKIFKGESGFAGEIGMFKLNANDTDEDSIANMAYHNYFDSVSLFNMLTLVKHKIMDGESSVISESVKDPDDIKIDNLIDAYLAGDALTEKVINASCRIIGSVLKNLCDFLDIRTVVLNGKSLKLGQKYIDTIQKNLSESGDIKIFPASLKGNTTIKGAINCAMHDCLLELI